MFTQEVEESSQLSMGFALGVGVIVLGSAALMPLPQLRKISLLVGLTTILVLIMWTMRQFRVVRIQVDERELRVGFSWVTESIPLDQVQACEPYTYRPLEWGGYGFRVGPQGKMYNVMGDHGVAVRVTTKDGRMIHFSARDPQAVCRAVSEAQIKRFIEV
jgi:hypothetical protein